MRNPTTDDYAYARSEREWLNDWAEVVNFGRALHDSPYLGSIADLFYFLEKPWKWNVEHWLWVNRGRPMSPGLGEEGARWEAWCEDVDDYRYERSHRGRKATEAGAGTSAGAPTPHPGDGHNPTP